MSYHLKIEKRAIKEIKVLPQNVQGRIKDKIKIILIEDPYPSGENDIKKIKGSKFWRFTKCLFLTTSHTRQTLYDFLLPQKEEKYLSD